MTNQISSLSLLSFVFHSLAVSESHDNRKWADDIGEWVPSWLKDLDLDPESWSEKLGVPRWKKDLRNKLCNGADGPSVDGARCGRGAFEREKTQLLEKLDIEQTAKLSLKAQLRTCLASEEELSKSIEEELSSKKNLAVRLREEEASKRRCKRDEQHCVQEMTKLQEACKGCKDRVCTYAVLFLHSICVILLYTCSRYSHKLEALRAEMETVTQESVLLKKELESELGGALTVNDYSENLGKEFSFNISDEIRDQGKIRTIKIQCPGVCQKDVFMLIFSNGCEVTIERQVSCGVDAVTWKKRFQFKPSEGVFEFKEDQAVLEHGYLTLVFDVRVFQKRVFRLPDSRYPLSDTKGENSDEQSQQARPDQSPHSRVEEISSQVVQSTDTTHIEHNPEDFQQNMLRESPELLHESPELEGEQDLEPSDTSSTSTLDGFEHVDHIPDMH